MSSLEVVVARLRAMQEAERSLDKQSAEYESSRKERDAERSRLNGQVGGLQEETGRLWKSNDSMNIKINECMLKLTSTPPVQGGASPPPLTVFEASPAASWHHGSLTPGTTVTEWKEPIASETLRVSSPGLGFETIQVVKPALSIPPGRMLIGGLFLPLLARSVSMVFRFNVGQPKVGILLAQRAEPPAPGMTFVSCNGKKVVYGVFYDNEWFTFEGQSMPTWEGAVMVVIYQFDVGANPQLRYVDDHGELVTRSILGMSQPWLSSVPGGNAPLTVGGYRATAGGPVIDGGKSDILLHQLEVYDYNTDLLGLYTNTWKNFTAG